MYFVGSRLAAGRTGTKHVPPEAAEAVSRALRHAAGEGSGLVHVFAQSAGEGSGSAVDLILFVVAEGVEAAEGYAAELLRRVLAEQDSGLELIRCAVELFLPAVEAQLGGEL